MTIVFTYSDPRGIDQPAVETDIGNQVIRFGTLALAQAAAIGEPAVSGVEIDDPTGTLNFVGHRAFMVRETAAPSNNQVIGRFGMQDRKVTRFDSGRTLNARRWSADLSDLNGVLSNRVIRDASGNRPAETAGDRLRWLLALDNLIFFHDYGHVTYPTTSLDACDYRGQRTNDVLADIAIEGGFNFWADYNEAHQRCELFFMDPNSSAYTSTLSVSNDPGDLDFTALNAGTATLYPPFEDAVLTRSPSRIAYGVYLAYANGAVYRVKGTTGEQFAYVDQTAPMSNVKSAARANRVADKFLNDNDEEDDLLTFSIKVPAAKVNDLRPGHLFPVKFTHLPGYEVAQNVRCLRRTVYQEEEGGPDWYRIEIEATPVATIAPLSCGSFAGQSVATYQNDSGSTTTGAIIPFSEPIALDSSNPHVVFAVAMVTMAGTPHASGVQGTGSFTTLHSGPANALDPVGATIYATNQTSSPTTVTGVYATGFQGHGNWGCLAVSFPSVASAPVQAMDAQFNVGGSGTLTFSTPPTVGNVVLIAGWMRSKTSTPPTANVTPSGTCLVNAFQQSEHWSIGGRTDTAALYVKVIDGTEGSTFGLPLNGSEWHLSISEWTHT